MCGPRAKPTPKVADNPVPVFLLESCGQPCACVPTVLPMSQYTDWFFDFDHFLKYNFGYMYSDCSILTLSKLIICVRQLIGL